VFKKTAVIPPKVGDQHYVNVSSSHANQMIASDQSSSINELYSEGRGEVLESSNYFMSLDTCPSPNMNGTTFNINGGRRDNDTTWSHFLSEDLLSLPTTSTSSFPNYGSMSYPPSKVTTKLLGYINLYIYTPLNVCVRNSTLIRDKIFQTVYK